MKLLRKVLWYGFLSIPLIVLLVLLFWQFLFWKPVARFLFHDLPFMGETFNKNKWDNALKCSSYTECRDVEMACIRGPMFRDLKRNHIINGTSKGSVVRLLGTAHSDRHNASCIVYELGMCSGLKIDYDWLNICFDPDDKVMSVYHYQS